MRFTGLLLILTFSLSACGVTIKGNGNVTEERRTVESFTKIETSGVFEIVLKKGEPSVVILTDENLLEHVITEVKNDRLIIKTNNKYLDAEEMQVTVYFNELDEVSLSGATTLRTDDNIVSESFELEISGAAEADLGVICEQFELEISGGAEVTVAGKANQVEIKISGAGEVNAFELQSEEAEIDVTGAGEIEISVENELSVDITGAGEVKYRGNPKITKSVTGAGELKQM